MKKAQIDQHKVNQLDWEKIKKVSVYISWSKVLGSLLGSGPCWPGTANIYISKVQGVCMQIVRCLSCQTVARIYLEEFELSQAKQSQ